MPGEQPTGKWNATRSAALGIALWAGLRGIRVAIGNLATLLAVGIGVGAAVYWGKRNAAARDAALGNPCSSQRPLQIDVVRKALILGWLFSSNRKVTASVSSE